MSDNGCVVALLTHVLVVPDSGDVVCGDVSVGGDTDGPEHLCAVNFIADVSEKWSVVSEGGTGVAVAGLGTVVVHRPDVVSPHKKLVRIYSE